MFPTVPSIEHYVRIVRDKAILRGLISVANAAIAKASEQADPADEILNEAEAAVFELSEKRIGKGFQGIKEIVRSSFGSVDALLQRGQRITGLATHYTDLDEMTSGFQKADLVILAARPSMGKTSFAMNIAENAAIDDGKVVGIFSLEMSSEALLQRLLCSRSIVDAHKMRTGSLWGDDMKKVVRAMEELSNAPIFIDDTPGISLSEMRAKARRLKQSQGRLDLLVVDYLQLMSGGSKRFENRTQEVSSISRGLKAIAKELQVPVIALSQLSRAPGKPRRRPPSATLRPSRIRLDRAGRRRSDVYFPRRNLQAGRSGAQGSCRNHHRQAAQWPDRQIQPRLPSQLDPLRQHARRQQRAGRVSQRGPSTR